MLFREARSPRAEDWMANVYLIGTGPGAADLLTLRAARLLQEAADVVLTDDLVSAEILAMVRPGARVLRVGKRGGRPSTPQDFIHRLMVRFARRGRTVLRLKGGDPFVFGRGGEEAEALRAHGIEVDVANGVTAAMAASASLGVPLTHRAHAHGVMLVTGHARPGGHGLHWPTLAAAAAQGLTLVVYMGVAAAASVRRQLLDARMPAATPVAVIENGTLPNQRVLLTDLAGLEATVASQEVRSPAVLVIGDSAAEASRLGWFGPPPALEAVRKTA